MRRETKLNRLVLQHRVYGSDQHYGKKKPGAFFSYQQLLTYLQQMSAEQLGQQVQLVPRHSGSTPNPIRLEAIIGIDKIENLIVDAEGPRYKVHSSVDWEYHPEDVTLVSDGHGFSDEGDSHGTMEEDADGEMYLIGNKTGKKRPLFPRKEGEPTYKVSKTAPFQLRTHENQSSAQLLARLEEIGKLEDSTGLRDEIVSIQAELYRRQFRV